MTNKLRVILIAVLVFIAVFIVGQFFLPDKYVVRLFTKTGTLRVESVPKTSVFVNSTFIGQTPLQVSLKTNVYTVKVVPEGSEASLISWSGTVRIFENTTTYINRELASKDLQSAGEVISLEKVGSDKAQIWVSTDPKGMIVSLDGQDRGVSPVFMDNISAGSHELAVRGERFLARTIKVNTVEGYKLTADFKLMIDENYKKPAPKKTKKPVSQEPQKLLILDTPTGWLRVREEPSLNASESAQVQPGDEFLYFEEQSNWYQIEYEPDKLGWVSGEYVDLITPTPSPTPEE